MAATEQSNDYRPFVPECNRRGIGKTLAYELKNKGLIEVFYIGRKPFVMLRSLDSLPNRLRQAGAE